MGLHPRDLSGFVTATGDGTAHLDLAVDGVDCAACLPRIEGGLRALPGVLHVRLNLTNHRLAIDWDDKALDSAAILRRLNQLGFTAHPFDPKRAEANEDREARRLLRCLGVAAFATMNIMLLSVSVWSGNVSDITSETRDFFHIVSAMIALPAVAYAGRPFFESAVAALKRRSLNMDVPISLGVLLAVGLSVVETLHSGRHAYFDSAVMLLTFLLAGRFLDQNMRRRTLSVAQNLAALRAESAAKLMPDGRVVDVPLSKLEPGDRILLRAGERVAADGVILSGASLIDQSLVTGETSPVAAGPGALVHAGTLNGAGVLTIQVTKPAGFLDEVSGLLEHALNARSRYVRLADRASRLYAPVVHVTALLTLTGWLLAGAGWHDAVMTAIAVLIITCPCALGLAVPAVQIVAAQSLFRSGVLLQFGDAVERLAAADTIVFDKTGTLTLPEAALIDLNDVDPADLADAARLAAASRHPLAMALLRAAGGGEPLDGAREISGAGVEADRDGVIWRLGGAAFCDAAAEMDAAAAREPGASFIVFRKGAAAPVIFAFRQGLRPDALVTIAALRGRGYAMRILSGDRPEAVNPVAAELGIKDAAGGLSPQDKIAVIAALRAAGRNVLMVGDGLNDAPALAAANVSLSPVTAAHLSQAAADALFLGEKLRPVLDALVVGRRARTIMVENLWLSVLYNLIAVPVAILGFATPLVAALAMSGSSILVTLNALRARATPPERPPA